MGGVRVNVCCTPILSKPRNDAFGPACKQGKNVQQLLRF